MAQNKKVGIWQTLSRTYDKGVGWSDNYPHGGPNEYSYTTGFYEYRPTTGKKAINNLVQPALAFSNVIANPALMTNLDAIIAQARKSELQYLNNHGFKIGNYADWSNLVIGVNEILSTSEIFERNIQLLKQYVDTTNTRTKDYRDMFSLFGDYIRTAAGKIIPTIKGRIVDMTANDFDILNKEIIQTALENLFSATDYMDDQGNIITRPKKKEKETLQAIQAYSELLQYMDKIIDANFIKNTSDILKLKDFYQKTQDTILYNEENQLKKSQKGYKSLPSIYPKRQKGAMSGNVGEVLRAQIGGALGGFSQTIHNDVIDLNIRIGQAGGKADRLAANLLLTQSNAVVKFNLASDTTGENQSKVVNSIDNLEQLMKQLDAAGAKGEMVLISDKSYLINQSFKIGWDEGENGGFSAQDATTLANIGDLLEKIKSPLDPTELIDYLSNCGERMILGNQQNDVMDAIATQIGSFLFNSVHIDFTVPSGINMVHILYLSGIYVPLSVVLEGIKEALYGTLKNFSVESFVTVQFQNGDTTPEKWKTEQEWINFRQDRITDTKLKIRFLEDFAQFIVDAVNGAIGY